MEDLDWPAGQSRSTFCQLDELAKCPICHDFYRVPLSLCCGHACTFLRYCCGEFVWHMCCSSQLHARTYVRDEVTQMCKCLSLSLPSFVSTKCSCTKLPVVQERSYRKEPLTCFHSMQIAQHASGATWVPRSCREMQSARSVGRRVILENYDPATP